MNSKKPTLGLAAAALASIFMLGVNAPGNAQTAGVPTTTGTAPAVTTTSPEPDHGGYMKMLKQMGLTPTQLSEIKTLHKSEKSQMKAIKANTALTPQEQKQQMKDVRKSTMASVRADLTPAEQQQLDSYLAQRKEDRRADRAAK